MHVKELFDLTGKVAIVTGGSRGLGREIAFGLGEAGARVVITARRQQWLDPTLEELTNAGIDALALACDVTNPEHAKHVVAQTVERFGRVDILINNAGITWKAPAETMSLDRWNQVMTVNVTGAFLMAQAVYPEMLKVGGGKIVNIASVAGLAGSSAAVMDAVGYNASKGAMISMSRDLAVKWAPKGIYVNAVAPGFFPTRMTEALLSEHQEEVETATPLGRVGQEGELKGAVLFLASRASDFVVGQVLVVDGGATAW